MSDIAIGPFSLPIPLLLFFAAVLSATAVGSRLARGNRARVERAIWIVIGLSLLISRIAFVLRYQALYFLEPLRMVDIRDGGWNAKAGLATAVIAAVGIAWRHVDLRKGLSGAMIAGCAVWGGGALALSVAGHAETLPDVTLANLEGEPVRLASLAGKPVVVNMWASWCPPCRREMPVLAKAQAERSNVVFIFANQGEFAPAVTAYLSKQGLVLHNVLLDHLGAIARQAGARGLPTTLFFNARVELVERRAGELSPATLAERLDKLRDAPAAGH